MPQRIPVQDAAADFKRGLKLRSLLIRAGYIASILVSLAQLRSGTLTEQQLIVWVLVPIPFLVLGAWEWGRFERAADELQREIVRDANSVAFRWTLVTLCVLLLAERAFTLPWVVALPAGLPPLTLTWEGSLLVGLLVWAMAFARAHRRRVGG